MNLHNFWFIISLFFSDFLTAEVSNIDDLKRLVENCRCSASVQFIKTGSGKPFFSINHSKNLIPASVTKLLVSIAALKQRGENFSLPIPVYYSGTFQSGKIDGSLYITANLNPYFVTEHVLEFAHDLRLMGISEITGDLVLLTNEAQERRLEKLNQQSGRGQAVSEAAWDAPLTQLMLNFGSVAVGVYPDPSMTRPTVAIDPFPVNGISLNNQLLWGSSNSVEIKRVKSQSQGDLIYLGGAVKKSGSLKKYYQSVSDGMSFTTEFIFSALKNVNIRVKGRLRRENRDSSGLTKFYDISGYNLKKWLEGMNTYSNNQIADLLGFLLSKDNADENLKTLSSSGNSTTGITIEAWSGLSTKNRFSSDFLARSLSESVANFQIFPTLLQSLPTPLSNGTLSRRGFSEAVKPVLRAKTGTLTEPYPVSSLAGYLDHPTSGVIAFSIILNDSNRATGLDKLKILEEKIINSVFALKSF